MRRLREQRGLSLVELVVVTGVLSVLTALVYETSRVQTGTLRRETARSETHGDLRIWMERMVRDVRQAGYDPTDSNAFGLVASETDEIRFTIDSNENGMVDSGESHGYRKNGTDLERWLGGSSWRHAASGVSSLVFTYHDAAGNVLTNPTTGVSSVEIEISAEAASGGLPGVAAPIVSRKATAEIRNDLS